MQLEIIAAECHDEAVIGTLLALGADPVLRVSGESHWMERLKTGIGFAAAKLSEILPVGRVAPFGQDDKQESRVARFGEDDKKNAILSVCGCT